MNEVICHGIPDTRIVSNGDLLSIDVSVYLDGVHGDNCASIVIDRNNNDSKGDDESEYNDDMIFEQKRKGKQINS